MLVRTAVAALALTLPLSACSGGEDGQATQEKSADQVKAAQAVSSDLQEGGDDGLKLTRTDADCVGEKMVDAFGVDKLVEYKVLTKRLTPYDGQAADMSRQDAKPTAAIFQQCADVRGMFFSGLPKNVPAKAKACLEEKVTDQVIEQAMAASFAGDDAGAQKVLGDAVMSCQQAG